MIKTIEIKVLPEKLNDDSYLTMLQDRILGIVDGEIKSRILTRKSIDARKRQAVYVLRYDIYIDEAYTEPAQIISQFKNVSNNESVIMKNLDDFFKGKTVVIVAHRLSTVKNADQIIVLDKGKIIETGNHETLTYKRGAYYHLVKNQLELGN